MIGLLAAFGDFLPLAIAVALTPIPVIATVLVVAQPRGAAAGTGFLAGWVASLSTVTLLLTFAVGEVEGTRFALGAWLQIVIGLLLLAGAVGKWRNRPRGDEEPPVPGWMRPLGSAGPGRAVVFGLALGANPKNIGLAAAAAAAIAYRGLSGPLALVAAALFVALGSASVIGGVVLRSFGGAPGARRLDGLKSFMLRNNHVIMMGLFLLVGLKILGDGLAELGAPPP